MMMNKAVMEAYKAGRFERIKQFASKKNTVHLISLEKDDERYDLIEKKFAEVRSLEQEQAIINKLNDKAIKTVTCMGRSQDVILYEYINRITLCEFLEQAEPHQAENRRKGIVEIDEEILWPFTKALDWLASFHEATGLAFYDINLRNFLVCKNNVIAIDFEDAKETDFSVDYGRFLAFIMTYSPSFTAWKKELVRQLEAYINLNIRVDFKNVLSEKERELANIQKRRSGNEKNV